MLKKTVFIAFVSFFSITAKKPVILWDLHGVLLQQKSQIKTVLNSTYLKEAFNQISWPLLKDIGALIRHHLYHDASSQEYIDVAEKHNNSALKKVMLEVANAQQPMSGMPELLAELSSLGYEQHIGSNIGDSSFRQLINPALYPELSVIFDRIDIPKSYIAHIKENVCIKKPNYRFFQKYLLKYNLDLTTQPIIFIDDIQDNVQAARILGFDAIQFKHPYQLRQELKNRGILVGKPAYNISDQTMGHLLYNPSLFYR